MNILQRNRWDLFLAVAITVICLLQLPVAPGLHRAMCRAVFEVCAILVFAAFVGLKLNVWVGLFLAGCTVSSVYPAYTPLSLLARNAVFFGCVWYVLVSSLVKNTEYILNALCVIALVHIGFQVLQYGNIDPVHVNVKGGPDITCGIMANINLSSALTAFLFPAFIRKRWWYVTPFLIASLVMSHSWGGVIAVGAGGVFFTWNTPTSNYRRVLYTGVIIASVLSYSLVDTSVIPNKRKTQTGETVFFSNSCMKRAGTCGVGLSYIKQKPIRGMGLGNWPYHLRKDKKYYNMMQAHNDLLQLTCETGVLILVILFGYILNVFRRYTKKALIPCVALCCILVNSLVSFPFHVATTAAVAVTWLALLEIQLRKGGVCHK